MGNRHHNRKLRAAVRAAMARTGESYQKALARLQSARQVSIALPRDVDLIPIDYFGVPLTLATFELVGALSCVVMSVDHLPQPLPKSPLFALAGQRCLS